MDNTIMILLLIGLVASALASVMIRNLVKASILLALVSGILTVIMFIMKADLAAVFELSVCSGLITVIFISAVSMTHMHSKAELAEKEKARRKRFILLPILLIVLLTGALLLLWPHLDTLVSHVAPPLDGITEPEVFWDKQQADLTGLIIIVLIGVYGVLIFFKEHDQK